MVLEVQIDFAARLREPGSTVLIETVLDIYPPCRATASKRLLRRCVVASSVNCAAVVVEWARYKLSDRGLDPLQPPRRVVRFEESPRALPNVPTNRHCAEYRKPFRNSSRAAASGRPRAASSQTVRQSSARACAWLRPLSDKELEGRAAIQCVAPGDQRLSFAFEWASGGCR